MVLYCSLNETSTVNGKLTVLLGEVTRFSGVGHDDYHDGPDVDEFIPSYGAPNVLDI